MRKMLTLCGLVAVFAALALAETYSGRLVDAACYDQQNETKNIDACNPTGATNQFAMLVAGKIVKLDDKGNTKAAAALKDRADRSTDPDKTPGSPVIATVNGKMDGYTLGVDTIELQ